MLSLLFKNKRKQPPGDAALPVSSRSDRGARYQMAGMLSDAASLADLSLLPALNADAELYRSAVAELNRAGKKRVPYFSTDAVRAIARDPNILEVVTDLLGDDAWVMWGANIQDDTPNAAGDWHVDLESWFWPSITVVVGLSGCAPDNATRFIPGSHRLSFSPAESPNARDDSSVLAAAQAADRSCDVIEQIGGFGDGRFYVFNARAWHSGALAASQGRRVLFLHYQRASDPRIPLMKDYSRRTFFREPADYIDGSPTGAPKANADLYPPPGRRWARVRPVG